VIDETGNIFSATPSDAAWDTPLVPDLGFCISSRGFQAYLAEDHPNVVAPRKRPRITPNPALVLKDGKPLMAIGTPGGDIQPQAMLQVFLNIAEFEMLPQQAVEAARFATYGLPNSDWPHVYDPGKVLLESPLYEAIGAALAARGHIVEQVPEGDNYKMGAVCVVERDLSSRVVTAGADPRRQAYAAAW
jgi:gamma-glutamyltranspeptidase/glutathione hydrolase